MFPVSCIIKRVKIASVAHKQCLLYGGLEEEVYTIMRLRDLLAARPLKYVAFKNHIVASDRLHDNGLLNFLVHCVNMDLFILM